MFFLSCKKKFKVKANMRQVLRIALLFHPSSPDNLLKNISTQEKLLSHQPSTAFFTHVLLMQQSY